MPWSTCVSILVHSAADRIHLMSQKSKQTFLSLPPHHKLDINEKKLFWRQTHGSQSAKPQSQKNLCPNKFRHMWTVMKLTYVQVLASGLKNKPGRSTQGEGNLPNKQKCYWSILYLFLQHKGSAASMSLLINKTGQGSFSDPQGNRHSTDCVHMAKLSPFHPLT